jgi:hypothetical protein
MSDCSTWNTVPAEFGQCARADFRTSIIGHLSPFASESAESDAIRVPSIPGFSHTGILAEAFAILHLSPNAEQPKVKPIAKPKYHPMFHVEH